MTLIQMVAFRGMVKIVEFAKQVVYIGEEKLKETPG